MIDRGATVGKKHPITTSPIRRKTTTTTTTGLFETSVISFHSTSAMMTAGEHIICKDSAPFPVVGSAQVHCTHVDPPASGRDQIGVPWERTICIDVASLKHTREFKIIYCEIKVNGKKFRSACSTVGKTGSFSTTVTLTENNTDEDFFELLQDQPLKLFFRGSAVPEKKNLAQTVPQQQRTDRDGLVVNLKRAQGAGYSAAELKAAGYSAVELRQAGYDDSELLAAGLTQTKHVTKAIRPKTCRTAAKQPTSRPKTCRAPAKQSLPTSRPATPNFTPVTRKASTLRALGYTAHEIQSIQQAKAAVLREDGYTAAEVKGLGYSATELKGAGYTATEISAGGYSIIELQCAGFTDVELLGAGFTAAILQLTNLQQLGYQPAAIKAKGFTTADMKTAGFSADTLIDAGIKAKDLAKAGFDSDEIAAAMRAAKLQKLAAKKAKRRHKKKNQVADVGAAMAAMALADDTTG